MVNIFMLPVDVFLYILSYLDILDRISFALTCRMFRKMCLDEGVFSRKIDLSRHAISAKQRGEIIKFFRDRQLTQHIRELDISNLCILNGQMDDQLEESISICPHLEALHILNCAMSLQRLWRILNQAPKLTSLSWSLLDFTSEDTEFLVNRIKSSGGICLQNIRHLHLEMNRSKSHIQTLKYFLSCCRDLEELELYTFKTYEDICNQLCFPLKGNQLIPGFPQISVGNKLQHLHSLMVVAVGYSEFDYCDHTYQEMLSDFIFSVVRRKSRSTKWKKFWIFPSIVIRRRHPIDLLPFLHKVHPDAFQSVEAITLEASSLDNAVHELKTFFESFGDNTVRSLQLRLPRYSNSILELCDPISRVGGQSLKFLCLSAFDQIDAEENMSIHSLFSNCSYVTELDLLECCFQKDICKPLSELKHLAKVQLKQCAITSRYCRCTQVEISKADLLGFVENCKNITHLDVRGCANHRQFAYRLTDDDLVALAKLRKLESLTICNIDGFREWRFLQNISEHCKFLTTLRFSPGGRLNFSSANIPILMDSAKYLKHLAIEVQVPFLGSNTFWNLLSHAKNLERLCINSRYSECLNIPVAAVETLKSLPRLHVLHLHTRKIGNVKYLHEQVKRMLEEKESGCRFSFEFLLEYRMNTWINHQTGYSLISNKGLPLNKTELCDMTPILDNPRF